MTVVSDVAVEKDNVYSQGNSHKGICRDPIISILNYVIRCKLYSLFMQTILNSYVGLET